MTNIVEHQSREDLEEFLACEFANDLCNALQRHDRAGIALSGGSTPRPIYERMSRDSRISWERVDVTLADERLTDPDSEDSNEHLVKTTLLTNAAAKARFFPLRSEGDLPCPVDTIILGMGEDGHFASLFPTAKELDAGLSSRDPAVLRMTPDPLPEGAPYPRMSLTLPTILSIPIIRVAMTGKTKRQVFREARQPGPAHELPIRALIAAGHPHLTVHWAP
ncbi:MAG: 6-phosphogluconolactonase [Parvularcula sp.]|jgi:6-phosphogluconolactonase|nr:6-phosphogluconolactonase [Parvularcula sp.]